MSSGRGSCRGGGRSARSCLWRGLARLQRARSAAGEGEQGDVAGALDGHAEPTLVTRAHAGHAARQNLAALLHELREDVGALVVDEVHLFDAKLADFLFAEILALAAARSAWTTGTAARAAFTARPTVAASAVAASAVTTAAVTATVSAATIAPGRCTTRR